MNPAIPQMLELQRLDQTTAALRAELEGMPKRQREAGAKLTGERTALAAAKEALTQAQAQRKKLELKWKRGRQTAKKNSDRGTPSKSTKSNKHRPTASAQ